MDLSLDTVVVAGHGAGVNPELAGLPTVAEPTAPLPANPCIRWRWPGSPPTGDHLRTADTAPRVSRLLADPAVRVCAVTTGPRWPDVSGNVVATGTRVEPVGAPRAQWLEETAQRHRLAVDAVASVLGQTPTTTGLHVAAAVAGAVGADRQLFLGASNPIRDVSLAGMLVPGVRVLSNRGVAGIDGANSTAIGAALAGGPTVALLGDLTFIHDATGLIIGPTEPRRTTCASSLPTTTAGDLRPARAGRPAIRRRCVRRSV